jgi:hypothetical protein
MDDQPVVRRCAGGQCMNSEHTIESCYARYVKSGIAVEPLSYADWLDAANWNGLDEDDGYAWAERDHP